jgi:hypothetical protein
MLGATDEGVPMKRTIVLVSILAIATTAFSANASAGAVKLRVYRGTIGDDDLRIALTLELKDGRPPALTEADFGAEMTCGDGTTQSWVVGMGWGGRPPGQPSLPSHTLDLDMVDSTQALHLHGMVQAVHGEGTISFAIPALTVDEQLQLCTTGELPWTVERTSPPVDGQSPPPPAAPLQVLRFVTPGGVRITMTRVR